MLNKPIEEITEADLQELVQGKIPEEKTIEYKEQLPSGKDADKKDFLRDIVSFANTRGGHIIYGVAEERDSKGQPKGVPEELKGLDVENIEREKDRLEKTTYGGIVPKIPGIAFATIGLQNGKSAIIIRIPRSWIAPHMVTYDTTPSFYKRFSSGKDPMDIIEIRDAFLLSETVIDRIRAFRKERLELIRQNKGQMELIGGPKIVMHLIPFNAFGPGVNYDLTELDKKPILVSPICVAISDHRYNFDGVIVYDLHSEQHAIAYTQAYRNGIIECVSTRPFDFAEGKKIIPSLIFENAIIEALQRFLNYQKDIGVSTPIALCLSLLDVQGYKMAAPPRLPYVLKTGKIDRSQLNVPEAIIEDYDTNADRLLKPCFDKIWNASGWPESPHYDAEGNWKPKS